MTDEKTSIDDFLAEDDFDQSDPVEDKAEEPTVPVLDLSQEVTPPKKLIRIAGEDYELLSYDNLSPNQEAAVTATFARFMRAFEKLGTAKNDKIAAEVALRLQYYREKLIGLMTTIPQQVYQPLGPALQGKILSAIQEEISTDDVLDGDDDEDDIV